MPPNSSPWWLPPTGANASSTSCEPRIRVSTSSSCRPTSVTRSGWGWSDMPGLDAPLRTVVGGGTAKALAEGLDLFTVGDLLRHYPRRYAKRGELTDLRDLQKDDFATIFAEVVSVNTRKIRPKLTKTDVRVTDGREFLTLTFFNQVWREKTLSVGSKAFFAGKVASFKGKRQLTNPEVQVSDDE